MIVRWLSRFLLLVLLVCFLTVRGPAPCGAGDEANEPAKNDPLLLEKASLQITDPLDRLPNNTFCKMYDLDLVGGRIYVIDMDSSNFATQVRVETATGQPVPTETLTLNLGVRSVFQPKETGRYHVIATSRLARATGSFTLKVREPVQKPFEVADALGKDDPRDKSATLAVCKRFELRMTRDVVHFIDMTSSVFDTQVRIEDASGVEVASQASPAGARHARLVFTPERTDTWTIIATTSLPGTTGPFSLTVRRPADGDANVFDRKDTLEVTDTFDQIATRSHQKTYPLELRAGQTRILELTSSAFQPYLRVEDGTGNPVAQGGDVRTARLTLVAPRDSSCKVIVTSRGPDQVGPFTLKIYAPKEDAPEGRRVEGRITATDPRQRLPTSRYVHSTEVKVRAGQRTVLAAHGSGFDPQLYVEAGDGHLVAQSEGGGPDALLTVTPPADDTWKVHVTSTADERTGPFTLRVLSTGPEPPAKPLEDAALDRDAPFDTYPTRKHHKACKVALTAGKTYQIDMKSAKLDAYLYLQDGAGALVGQDDDSGDAGNARLRFTPPANGTWTVIASSAAPGATGAFTLRVAEWPVKLGQEPVLAREEALTAADPLYVVPTRDRARSCAVDLEEGRSYLIRAEGKDADPYVRVEDDKRTIVGEAGAGRRAAELLVPCKQTGTYRLIAGATLARPSARVTVQMEPLSEVLNQSGRLEAGPRLTLPTQWRRAEVLFDLEAGRAYLVELENPRADASLTVQPARTAAPDDGETRSPRVVVTPSQTGAYRGVILAKEEGPFTVVARPLTEVFGKTEALEVSDPLDTQPTQRRRKKFTVNLAQQSYLVVAESEAFEPLARVLDDKGHEVARTDVSTSTRKVGLIAPRAAGPYTLVLTSKEALQTGACRVQVVPLTTEREKTERLTAADPADRIPTGKRCKAYDLDAIADSLYLIDLVSPEFQPAVRVEDERGRLAATGNVVPRTKFDSPFGSRLLFAPPRPEKYRVMATATVAGQYGPMKLTVQPFTTTFTRSEDLTPADPMDRALTPRHCKVYEQELTKDTGYVLELASSAFTPVLRVEDARGYPVGLQQGGPGGPATFLFFPEKSEKYKIIATALPGQTGAFTLRLSRTRTTSRVAGQLTADDPFDPILNNSFRKTHAVKMTAGKSYVLNVESTEFQPHIRLDSARGKHLRLSPDISTPTSARIIFVATQTETYELTVTSVKPSDVGLYRFWVEE